MPKLGSSSGNVPPNSLSATTACLGDVVVILGTLMNEEQGPAMFPPGPEAGSAAPGNHTMPYKEQNPNVLSLLSIS